MTKSTGKVRPWTDEEQWQAQKLYAEHQSYKVVGRIMGRSDSTIRDRLQGLRGPCQTRRVDDTRVPDSVLQDRDRRMQLAPRDLTAAFFGDPLPGMSALERR